MPSDLDNFLDSIHQSHVDNAQRVYWARTLGPTQSTTNISPLTNFVFEFFLYNSLYAVNWPESFAKNRLVHHDREIGEAASGSVDLRPKQEYQ